MTTDSNLQLSSGHRLNALSPVVITTTDEAAISALKAANPDLSTAWTADTVARLRGDTTKVFDYSDNWYADRAAMLAAVVQANQQDIADGAGLSVPGATGMHYLDVTSGKEINIGLVNDVLEKRQTLFGGDGNDGADKLTGKRLADRIYGGAGDDELNGMGGNDYLEGGSGNDTYTFTGTWGKDTIVDTNGQGSIVLGERTLGNAVATGKANQWGVDLGAGQVAYLNVLDDARSATGKRLVITQGTNTSTDTANSVTINHFNLTQALGAGYLGIRLDPTKKLAVTQSTGTNVWSDTRFTLDQLAGQTTGLVEGTGKTFTLYLNAAAKAGDTITLALSGLADKFKALLGDSTVDANGAVLTLTEGQTQISFALVQEGDVTADGSTQLSATYTGEAGSVTSNSFGVNLQDSGEIDQTKVGDQRAKIIGLGKETQEHITSDKPTFNTGCD